MSKVVVLYLMISAFFLTSVKSLPPVYIPDPPVQDSVYVCISQTAYAYHDHFCQGLKRCTHKVSKISLKDAKNQGKTPCGFCY